MSSEFYLKIYFTGGAKYSVHNISVDFRALCALLLCEIFFITLNYFLERKSVEFLSPGRVQFAAFCREH